MWLIGPESQRRPFPKYEYIKPLSLAKNLGKSIHINVSARNDGHNFSRACASGHGRRHGASRSPFRDDSIALG
jgi:hypothetical protein